MPAKPTPGTNDQIALGVAFRRARTAAGVTQEQIKVALGVSINTIRWHEAGARCLRADQLVEAARVFKCAPADLTLPGEDHDRTDAA